MDGCEQAEVLTALFRSIFILQQTLAWFLEPGSTDTPPL